MNSTFKLPVGRLRHGGWLELEGDSEARRSASASGPLAFAILGLRKLEPVTVRASLPLAALQKQVAPRFKNSPLLKLERQEFKFNFKFFQSRLT